MPSSSRLASITPAPSLHRSAALPTEIVHAIFSSMRAKEPSNSHHNRFGAVCTIWRAVSFDQGSYHITTIAGLSKLVDLFKADFGRRNGTRRLVIELDSRGGSVGDAMRGMKELLEMTRNLEECDLTLEMCFEAVLMVREWDELFAVLGTLGKMRRFVVKGFSVQVGTLFELIKSWRSLKVLDLSTDGVGFDKFIDGSTTTISSHLHSFLSDLPTDSFPRLNTLRYTIDSANDLPLLDVLLSNSKLRSLHILRSTDSEVVDAGLAMLLGKVLPGLYDFRHSSCDDEFGESHSPSLSPALLSTLSSCETLHLDASSSSTLSFLPALRRLKKLTLVNVRRSTDFEVISAFVSGWRKGDEEVEIGFRYVGFINLRTREWLRVLKEECRIVGVGFCSTSIVPWALCPSLGYRVV